MQLAIIISGMLASVLFILSGLSFIFRWGNFRIIAIAFLGTAITMFILMIIRNVKDEWKIGEYRPKEKK